MFYTGKVWTESELKVHRLVQKFTERQLQEACAELLKAQKAENDTAVNGNNLENKNAETASKQPKAYRNFVLARRDTLKIKAVLTEAKPMVEIKSSLLDADGFKLNTPNRTVDLYTKELHPHNPADYCTKMTNASPTTVGSELFAKFLEEITCGNKSPEYAELRGKRLVIAAELEEGVRLDTSIVKKLYSTDPIYAEKRYKDPFSFIPSHAVVLYTNHLPNVGTSDDDTWRRLVVVPFNAVIQKNNDIKNYADYLFNNAGGAVLSWIIESAYRFIKAEFKIEPPEVVGQVTNKYREENDWLNNYITECCEVGKGYQQSAKALYENYRIYCKQYGEYTRDVSNFNKALVDAGFTQRRSNSFRYWIGLRLLPISVPLTMPYVRPAEVLNGNTIPDPFVVTDSDGENQNFTEDEEVEF